MSQGFTSQLPIPLPVNQGGTGVTTSDWTAASLTFNPTTQGIVGTATNDNAGSGYVGETITSAVTTYTGGITNGVVFNATSITITPGDWDVSGSSVVSSSTAPYTCLTAVNTTSATLPADAYISGIYSVGAQYNAYGVAPTRRFSVNTNTTIYLVVSPAFTGTGSYQGQIIARRVR